MTTGNDRRVAIDASVSLALTEAAQKVRLVTQMLRSAGSPSPESKFERLGRPTPQESVERRVANYLAASAEHLTFWANTFAPLKFHPEQTTEVTLRPTFTLARAAMEASSQAVWLMDSTDPRALQRRYLAMVLWELGKRKQSESEPEARALAAAAELEFLEASNGRISRAELNTPGNYLGFVRAASNVNGMDLDADQLEQLWRKASGVAHGHLWVTDVLTELRPDPHANTPKAVVRVPSQESLVEVIDVAATMLQVGVLNYLDFLGADIADVIEGARAWLASIVPLKDESIRDTLLQGAK